MAMPVAGLGDHPLSLGGVAISQPVAMGTPQEKRPSRQPGRDSWRSFHHCTRSDEYATKSVAPAASASGTAVRRSETSK